MTKTVLIHLCVGACLLACTPEKTSQKAAENQPVETQKENVTVVDNAPTAAEAPAPETAAAAVAEVAEIAVNTESVQPGTAIGRNGESLKLMGTPLEIGKPLPEMELKNAINGEAVSTKSLMGKVLMLSIIPAVETKTCSAQSHYLETKGKGLGENIIRITVSRDSAEKLQQFAQNEENSNVMYLTDPDKGVFGAATGLGIEGQDILARSVVVVDAQGIVRHIQVVPEMTQLPDMDKAFQLAQNLATESQASAEKPAPEKTAPEKATK